MDDFVCRDGPYWCSIYGGTHAHAGVVVAKTL
jgi:hypothetical protein